MTPGAAPQGEAVMVSPVTVQKEEGEALIRKVYGRLGLWEPERNPSDRMRTTTGYNILYLVETPMVSCKNLGIWDHDVRPWLYIDEQGQPQGGEALAFFLEDLLRMGAQLHLVIGDDAVIGCYVDTTSTPLPNAYPAFTESNLVTWLANTWLSFKDTQGGQS